MRLLRVREVAKILGIARSTVYGMLNRGELPIVRVGGSVRVPERDLETWIRDRTEPATTRDPIPKEVAR